MLIPDAYMGSTGVKASSYHWVSCEHLALKMQMFVSEWPIDNDYFESINRGSLKFPSAICLKLGQTSLLTMQHLISTKYESIFVKCSNQKHLLIHFLLQLSGDWNFSQIWTK